jgi:hypothetical protein
MSSTATTTSTKETGAVPSAAEVADRLAIADVLAVHSRGVDRADEAALKSAYWADAEVAYGGYNGNAHGFCEILPASIKRYAGTAHKISNICIEFQRTEEREEARVETYVTAYHYLSSDAEGAADVDTEMTYIGRYLDTMEKRNNVWKIRFRRVLMDWNQNANATAILQGPPFEGLARGTRWPDDPLYELLS